MRYEVHSWVAGDVDQMWKTWGRHRAVRLAEDMVRAYRKLNASEFEVGIFTAKSLPRMKWYYSAAYEAAGEPPLEYW